MAMKSKNTSRNFISAKFCYCYFLRKWQFFPRCCCCCCVCVCVCVCVSEWVRERERERECACILLHKVTYLFSNQQLSQPWYKLWIWSSRNDFIAGMPVYLQPVRGITFKVLLLSSYALSQLILPLLETFLEFLSWNSFQCHYCIFLDIFSILKSSLKGRHYF
jgi:hypothetical protein